MPRTRPSPLPRQLARLQRRLLGEIALANVVGGTVLVMFYLVFVAARLPVTTQRAVWVLAAICLFAFLLVLAISRHLIRPLILWLAQSDGETPASQRIKIGVAIAPFVLTAVTFVLWTASAVGFGLVQVYAAGGGSLRSFFTTFGATMLAALTVAAIMYLRIEGTWRPWVPRFFLDDDPTALPLPRMNLLRSRLGWAFVLGSAVPLIAMAIAVSTPAEQGFSTRNTELLAWMLAGAGVFGSAILSIHVRHSITTPVDALQDAMEAVQEGNLDVSVPVDRVDELGRLQSGFNEMVDGLRQRREIEDLYGRQVGSDVAQMAIDGGVALGGETRVASALFVDLAAFSSLAEELAPNEVATVLNTVFDVIVGAVNGHDGLVNKFQGDAVLAVFGAPRNDDRHAVHALEAAEEIARGLEEMDVEFGIGISSGEVFAGNVGTEDRFEYTVIGDPVNVAARLEELTRDVDRRVLLAERTANFARKHGGRIVAAIVPVEPVTLRGRTAPTQVFSLSPHLWRGSDLEPADIDVVSEVKDGAA